MNNTMYKKKYKNPNNKEIKKRLVPRFLMVPAGLFFLFLYGWAGEEKTVIRGEYLGQRPPVKGAELFAPGIVSTGMHEHGSAVFSPDMQELYFVAAAGHPKVILFMTREGGRWTPPATAPFSGKYADDNPFFDPGGRRLYFQSKRPLRAGRVIPEEKYHVWYVQKTPGGWSEARFHSQLSALEPVSPSMAENGNFYYASSKPGGAGDMDIYVSRRKDGKYAEPENLGNRINTSHMEAYVFADPSEEYVIFMRFNGKEEESGLFISFREPGGAWGPAVNMGPGVNRARAERFPFVSPDGKYLFFNRQYSKYKNWSQRPLTMKDLSLRHNAPQYARGCGDIYWMGTGFFEELKKGGSTPGERPAVVPAVEETGAPMVGYRFAGETTAKETTPQVPVRGEYFGRQSPGEKAGLFAPNIVSGAHDEHGSPAFSPDGKEVFFAIGYSGQIILAHARRDKSGTWTEPETASFSGRYSDIVPVFAPDGKTFYFRSRRPRDKKAHLPAPAYHNWMVKKSGEQWGEPAPNPFFDDYIISSVTPGGTIYCYAAVKGGSGGYDMYRSRRVKGWYEQPVNLGEAVNGKYRDAHPAVGPGERYLVFASYRRSGGAGLYISMRGKDGAWGTPVNLKDKIGAAPYDDFPRISPDGKYLFFLSWRFREKQYSEVPLTYPQLIQRMNAPQNGRLDVYWVDLARIIVVPAH